MTLLSRNKIPKNNGDRSHFRALKNYGEEEGKVSCALYRKLKSILDI